MFAKGKAPSAPVRPSAKAAPALLNASVAKSFNNFPPIFPAFSKSLAVPVVPNASVTFNISVSPTPNIPVGESS